MIVGVSTFGVAQAYRRSWTRRFGNDRTPTGFGALLAPVMVLGGAAVGLSGDLTLALALGGIGTLVYWFDDAFEMSARVRIALAAVTGLAIGGCFLLDSGTSAPTAALLLALIAFAHVALVNTINMQDGADLNLATLLTLTALLTIAFGQRTEWAAIGWVCLAFALPFAMVNRKPRSLYFGDSGCFALAVLFTTMGAAFLMGTRPPPPEVAIALGLPVSDMAFVTAHRIRIRQKFTVRHYFHLYQRLQKSQNGFAYLLPQVASVALALGISSALQSMNLERVWAVAVATVAAGLIVFWIGHLAFVHGEPGPPAQRIPG
ncbi:MAG: hypothetical protein K2X07_03970 [Caulobacteraceae bacterium]|nr:hypothetical protein [Caulobacteraceae bacterium]